MVVSNLSEYLKIIFETTFVYSSRLRNDFFFQNFKDIRVTQPLMEIPTVRLLEE